MAISFQCQNKQTKKYTFFRKLLSLTKLLNPKKNLYLCLLHKNLYVFWKEMYHYSISLQDSASQMTLFNIL